MWPFAQALEAVGTRACRGVHMTPQVAHSSKNSFAVQVGGVDWLFNPRVFLRAEADYVRSNALFQLAKQCPGLGAAIHF